jgi:isopentenyl-diphosphate Delta-isomerase
MPEFIQYVDDTGQPTGETEEKLQAHHLHTKKHLAFSCYLFDEDNYFLVTKRASTKKVWPDVTTNSCCGHPAPGETFADAIRRRCKYELGINYISEPVCVAERYSYVTPPYNGIVENEFCPVFAARTSRSKVHPNPDEVKDAQWVSWDEFKQLQKEKPDEFSFWCKEQTALIDQNIQAFLS